MKLQLLGIIFCIGSISYGCQEGKNLAFLLHSAASSVTPGHLGIFYDSQYSMQEACNSGLSHFRSNHRTQQKFVIDYIVNTQVDKIDYAFGISQSERKNLFSLLNSTDKSKRGLVLYYTISADQTSYVEEIKQIRDIGWHVIVMCHDLEIAKDIDKAFTDLNKNVLIIPKKIYFSSLCNTLFLWRNVLLLGGIFIAALVCHKYGYR